MTQNRSYHIVADGFTRVHIRSYSPEEFKVSNGEQQHLDDFVRKQIEVAEKRGGSFYDGHMVGVRMGSLVAVGDTLAFDTQHIRYSHHAGLFRGSAKAPLQAVYVNAILLTRDENSKIVFGTTQATEANWMGKLGIPAGGLTLAPDGYPSLGAQVYAEGTEETGLTPDYQLTRETGLVPEQFVTPLIPGWFNGMSTREGNYHLTCSFIGQLLLTEVEMQEWFSDWKAAQEKWMTSAKARGEKIGKIEFKDLRFLPNDPVYLEKFIAEQDAKGKDANLLGKSLDVIEEWARSYSCDLETLKSSKKNARIYLPQPSF